MTSITITLPEDRLAKLRDIAARLNVTPEGLARVSIEEPLTPPDEAFKQAAEYVLQKNSELYRQPAVHHSEKLKIHPSTQSYP